MTDLRRFIPRADEILASPAVEVARRYMAEHIIRTRINKVLAQARAGDIAPQAVMDEVAAVLADATPYS
ncbi:MAG: L-seryl-tRNA(Sec) selenium transferase, partial [Corynebacterium casei]